MPGYKGHLCGGLIAYVVVFFFCLTTRPSLLTACEWLFCTLAGSLFPDIDVKSKGQKYFYYVVMVLFLFLLSQEKFQLLSCVSILAITPMLSRHRGLFHKAWFLITISIIGWLIIGGIFPNLRSLLLQHSLFFCLGALSHLVLDRVQASIKKGVSR